MKRDPQAMSAVMRIRSAELRNPLPKMRIEFARSYSRLYSRLPQITKRQRRPNGLDFIIIFDGSQLDKPCGDVLKVKLRTSRTEFLEYECGQTTHFHSDCRLRQAGKLAGQQVRKVLQSP